MRELVIKKKKYIQIPEDLEKVADKHLTVEKLSLQQCYNGTITLHAKHWPKLQYLELIGCSYLTISLYFTQAGPLNQIYMNQCDSLDIGEILGYLPQLEAWLLEDCKFIKFKGQIKGQIGLKSLEFSHVLRSEIFSEPTSLPDLSQILIQDRSNFFKINFDTLEAPRLRIFWFQNSNYINLQSLGAISSQLDSFRFDNCKYPKLNVDFMDLKTSVQRDIDPGGTEPKVTSNFNSQVFRKVKKRKKKKTKKSNKNKINPFRDPNSPDLELLRTTPPIDEVEKEARQFLDGQYKEKSLSFKYCPECGVKNPKSATFCSECGEKFRGTT